MYRYFKAAFVIYTLNCLAIGCSSVSRAPTSENQEDVVVSRIDDLSSRPSWLKESKLFYIADGQVHSIGVTTIPASNHRVEAAYRIAQNSAKGSIAEAISSRLSFIFQNAEEGTGMDDTQARYIGASASELVSSSIQPGNLYWEKVATTSDDGQRSTIYKVFAEEVMPESDFKRAIIDAVRKREGKGGLSADFAQKVNEHWDSFVSGKPDTGGNNKQEVAKREPASNQN